MIKFDNVLLYQFGFYSPESRLEPSPHIIGDLLKAFSGTEFMPNIIQEMQIGPVTQTRQQLHLITKSWRIEFEPNRVAFTKSNVPGSEIGTFEDFTREIKEFCSRLSSVIPITGNRLSYVTKGFLPEMKESELTKIESKLLKLPTFYLENSPVEWVTRNVARYNASINNVPEVFNVITDINRVQVLRNTEDEVKEFSGIEIGFDINTFQKNIKQRFSLNDSETFMGEAKKLNERLLGELEEIIYG